MGTENQPQEAPFEELCGIEELLPEKVVSGIEPELILPENKVIYMCKNSATKRVSNISPLRPVLETYKDSMKINNKYRVNEVGPR